MFCRFCNKEISDGPKFCPECGKGLQDLQKKEEKEVDDKLKVVEKTMEEAPLQAEQGINIAPIKRTTEFVLGLLGGIFGIFSSLMVMLFGGLVDALSSSSSGLGSLGMAALLFSIIGVVSATMVRKKGKLGGFLMILSAIGGLIATFAGYIIPFILLLIGGIISVRKPDQKPEKVKWVIWIPVGIVISILIFVISMTSSGDTSDTSAINNTEYSMGDEVVVGDIGYIVNAVTPTKALSDEFFDYTAEGVFLMIDVSIKNLGKEAVTIDSTMVKIVESDGTTYDSSIDLNSSDLFLDSLNPKTIRDYNIVFDVPAESQDYMLQVSDSLFGMKTANIKLDYVSDSIVSTLTPEPIKSFENNNDIPEENSEDINTNDTVSDVDTTQGTQTNNVTSIEEEQTNQEGEINESDSVAPIYYSTVIEYIENSYYYEDGRMLEWTDDDGYYKYGFLSQMDVDYANLIVEMECVNTGKAFYYGSDYINYVEITSIGLISVKADEYYDDYYDNTAFYLITVEEAKTLVEDTYSDYHSVTYIPDNDYIDAYNYIYYYFELYDEEGSAYALFVDSYNSNFYEKEIDESGFLFPDELLKEN